MFNSKRVGIMGTGSIAGTMARTLKGMKGVTCYAVASRTYEKAEAFAKENKVKRAYGSYQEMCMDPKVDLIYVATPHSAHFENTCLALEYGKPVLCEKAFALNEKQAAEMFKMAAEKDLFLAEAMWTRFIPLAGKLKEILSSNKIGDIMMVTADLSYNIAWKQRITDASLGGGALLDLGVYGLNFASMVLGNDVVNISAVSKKGDGGMDMQDSITLSYRDGQIAVITCSAISCGSGKGFIFGTNGHIEVENINNFESITVYNNAGIKEGFYKKEKQITGYEYEVMSAINSLNENWKECPEMPKAQSLEIMKMMDFIREQIDVKFPQDDDNLDEEQTETSESVESAETVEEIIDEVTESLSEEVSEDSPVDDSNGEAETVEASDSEETEETENAENSDEEAEEKDEE
ncbi:Gfo/Idh/MocA family protein [Butyrivibrio sp. MB2005]|uniref:Gfo/Idh/MocA family protein n=1 Tax=Butyrivibrio sp. MB2005 TaxID=1280678 RepID=UPI000428FB10|nr:Gfo/Idh/MocA family oxidoreductase [Butyrivibrio sp. MB2005]